MVNYIKMKMMEIKLKRMLYSTILVFIDNKHDIIITLSKLLKELSITSPDELQDKIIETIAELYRQSNDVDNSSVSK
ncbi:hypothetical protein LJC58_03875 [Lachnospiraceae bacterium OttesenSCG-928-D06]|nr:hypothetical protein [Lachnospiraceae bacterium OttesenSCG-928-D06]